MSYFPALNWICEGMSVSARAHEEQSRPSSIPGRVGDAKGTDALTSLSAERGTHARVFLQLYRTKAAAELSPTAGPGGLVRKPPCSPACHLRGWSAPPLAPLSLPGCEPTISVVGSLAELLRWLCPSWEGGKEGKFPK